MTIRKRPVVTCDGLHGCRARFLGDFGETSSAARKRAKARGWASYTTSADMFRVWVDLCPRHSDRMGTA